MIFAPITQAASRSPIDASALESFISALESAISALEREIKALEISSTAWEPWVWVFSALVVVGVVMELWVVRHDWREEWETFAIWYFIGATRSLSRPDGLKLWVEVISVVLIAMGVAGELGIGVEISHINGAIRGKASELRTKNAELRRDSDQLVALVNERAGKLEKEAAEIEESVAPRRLSIEQRESLTSRLTKFHGRNVVVFTDPSDAEAALFASDIYRALKAAHWDVDSSSGIGNGGGKNLNMAPNLPSTGVDVPCGPPKLHDAAGKALVRELVNMGFDSQCSTRVTGLWPLEILARPLGPQGDAKLRAEAKKQASSSQIAKP